MYHKTTPKLNAAAVAALEKFRSLKPGQLPTLVAVLDEIKEGTISVPEGVSAGIFAAVVVRLGSIAS
jgi:hypothetical protein